MYVINRQGNTKIHMQKIVMMAECAFGTLLEKKRNTKSSVWENFGLMATEDGHSFFI